MKKKLHMAEDTITYKQSKYNSVTNSHVIARVIEGAEFPRKAVSQQTQVMMENPNMNPFHLL